MSNSILTRFLLPALLVAILLLSLAACGQSTTPSDQLETQPAETSAGATETNPGQTTETLAVTDQSDTAQANEPGPVTPTTATTLTTETSGANPVATGATTQKATQATTAATASTQATTAVPTTAVPTTSPGSLTNWTINAQGQIIWYDPAPVQIAYNPAKTISVTIPEGYTLVDICKLLEKKGVQTFYHLFSAALNGDYPNYGFIDVSRATANRRYVLEGYLFPDTYQFHVGEKPYNVFAKFLSNTNAVLAGYTPYAGMTMDQVITLASLIEEEAFTGDTRANVSSVLHNRLNSGKRLELDKTINYVEWYIKPLIQSSDSTVINAYNSYYNTYKCSALPAGPITNPGRMAIEAAINPAATNYLYFVTDAAGNYYYATTWEEHQANLKTAGLA